MIVPSFGSMREQDRALEAVPLREDLRELRHRLLGAVLLVAADEDDVLALARGRRLPSRTMGGSAPITTAGSINTARIAASGRSFIFMLGRKCWGGSSLIVTRTVYARRHGRYTACMHGGKSPELRLNGTT